MFKKGEYKVTFYRRKQTPEEKEHNRLTDERWAKAAERWEKARTKASSTPQQTAK